MKNVLFITYFWPPSGKATVHWPLFIIKHLPKHGWQPSVLTVDEDSFSHKDESLLNEIDSNLLVVKTAANDPFTLYRKFLGKKQGTPLVASETISLENDDWKHRFSIWIRMNLFVPDARIGWIFSAVKGAKKILHEKKIDAIISIGPPHSSHLIGKKLSKKYGIPHVPVLIDPWVDIFYYRNFKRNPITLALDNYFERSTFSNARRVIFVTRSAEEEYLKKYPWLKEKTDVLYWGYNEEAFAGAVKTNFSSNEEILLHTGNIFDAQNPPHFWKAVKTEIDRGRKLKLRFAGTVSPGIRKAIDEAGLSPFTTFLGFLSYSDVVKEMMNATYLLVCATEKRHVPGKLFEYLRTGNKIIAFGDDNEEMNELIEQANAGILLPYYYDQPNIFNRPAALSPNPATARLFSREVIAEKFTQILIASTELLR